MTDDPILNLKSPLICPQKQDTCSESKPSKAYSEASWLSHGLVIIGAYFQDTPTDLPIPDFGRNQKMMFSSCHFHIVF